MLQSIDAAYCQKGRKIAAIARDMEMTPGHVSRMFAGVHNIPRKIRARLSEAIGAAVDWAAYDAEFAAKCADRGRITPETPRAAPPAPAPESHQMPTEAPKRPATPPRRLTATPPAAHTHSPPPAPKKGGLFGFLTTTEGGLFE